MGAEGLVAMPVEQVVAIDVFSGLWFRVSGSIPYE